jgi:putative acetyltransferase
VINIRPEQPGDIAAVHAINETAFSRATEADIVDSLRIACPDAVSLVAVKDGKIVAHIFFSPASISTENKTTHGMGLAPMAVLPDHQREGIGSLLVRAGIDTLSEGNCPFIIVLGHPQYYQRFGFVPASQHGILCQWKGVPNDAFMVLVLDEEAMAGVSGPARYREEFDKAM